MKRTMLSLIVACTLTTSALAADMKAENDWEKGAKDAWIDGKAEATLLFNGNLNSFDINTDVKNGKVILTGKVKTSVDKKLAEELVENIDGVTAVDNRLTIMQGLENSDGMTASNEMDAEDDMEAAEDDAEEATEDASSELLDAKIATVIKTRLLMDSDISGFDIDVDVEQGNVTLTGEVESDAERELAIEIAQNASDVKNVEDNLKVMKKTAMTDDN
ncbi:BON domain-containing protein [Salinimonas sp. HHU 13199]|uniref:BON domain-containing protein n=1 Tax=Salinimonas profundi TaxID=2729140 RepID=A0ABR8LJF1_9ALTE|nr:BON domain-containing protein [Salinimonas profundi]MBD3584194.1 BON domain-containing protein [Salinimonas profundi]